MTSYNTSCGHVECAGLSACIAPRTYTATVLSAPAGPEEPREGLREPAAAVVAQAEADDNFEGEYVDYLVPADALDALRAALATPAAARTRNRTRVAREPSEPCPAIEVERALSASDTGAEETPWVEDGVPNYAEWRARSDTGAEERLRAALLDAGGRLPEWEHWRTKASSKPSDPDDVRWECACGYAGSPDTVRRHWNAMARG